MAPSKIQINFKGLIDASNTGPVKIPAFLNPKNASKKVSITLNQDQLFSAPKSPIRAGYFGRVYKKEIKSHESELRRTAREKLIESTNKLIQPANSRQFYQELIKKQENLFRVSHNQQLGPRKHEKTNESQSNRRITARSVASSRKKEMHEKIHKGVTSRTMRSNVTRVSAEIQRTRRSIQNAESEHQFNSSDFKWRKGKVPINLTKSLHNNYSRIDRSIQSDEKYPDERSKPMTSRTGRRSPLNMTLKEFNLIKDSKFPHKRQEPYSEDSLTISQMSKDYRKTSNNRQIDGKEYYQPKMEMRGNSYEVKTMKRPNTMLNTRGRRNSEIQPW